MGWPAQYEMKPCNRSSINSKKNLSQIQYTEELDLEDVSSMVLGYEGTASALIKVGQRITNSVGLDDYINWSLNSALPAIENSKQEMVLTVVTFNEPIPYEEFEQIVGLSVEDIEIESLQVSFENLSVDDSSIVLNEVPDESLESQSKHWTLSAGDIRDNQYMEALDRMANTVSSNVVLSPVGVVAATIWLKVDRVESINNNESVFLVDVAPSYSRMLAMGLDQVQIAEDNEHHIQLSPDGFPDSLETHVHNLYYALDLATSAESDQTITPTSVEANRIHTLSDRSMFGVLIIVASLCLITIPTTKLGLPNFE